MTAGESEFVCTGMLLAPRGLAAAATPWHGQGWSATLETQPNGAPRLRLIGDGIAVVTHAIDHVQHRVTGTICSDHARADALMRDWSAHLTETGILHWLALEEHAGNDLIGHTYSDGGDDVVVTVEIDGLPCPVWRVETLRQRDPFPGGHLYVATLTGAHALLAAGADLPLGRHASVDHRTASSILMALSFACQRTRPSVAAEPLRYLLNSVTDVELGLDRVVIRGVCSPVVR